MAKAEDIHDDLQSKVAGEWKTGNLRAMQTFLLKHHRNSASNVRSMRAPDNLSTTAQKAELQPLLFKTLVKNAASMMFIPIPMS